MTDLIESQSVDLLSTDPDALEHAKHLARVWTTSEVVPERYRGTKPTALANTLIAMELAKRLDLSPLEVMQNLYVVYGTPAWSSKFLIGQINACGKFRLLRFEFEGAPMAPEWSCRAWTTEVDDETQAPLYGPVVTMDMARREGWLDKKGSKWQTMPQLMLMYRAAAFWSRVYAPQLSLGFSTLEEMADVGPITEGRTVAPVSDLTERLLEPKKENENDVK